MNNFICKKCGSTEYEIKDKANGTGIAHGLYCAKCGFWHKWLGKEELKQYAKKESKDEIIAKLQSENAALRERLKKAVELPCIEPMTTWDWDNEMGIGESHFGDRYQLLYRDKDGEFIAYVGLDKEEAEAELAKLKGGNNER